jgi:hypothetical protein
MAVTSARIAGFCDGWENPTEGSAVQPTVPIMRSRRRITRLNACENNKGIFASSPERRPTLGTKGA